MPLAWSSCLWHGPHTFGIVPLPVAWSPCLQNYSFVTAHIFCIFGVFRVFRVFRNFDFVILLQPNRWPRNTLDGPKWSGYVLATSHINAGCGHVPPKKLIQLPQNYTQEKWKPKFLRNSQKLKSLNFFQKNTDFWAQCRRPQCDFPLNLDIGLCSQN